MQHDYFECYGVHIQSKLKAHIRIVAFSHMGSTLARSFLPKKRMSTADINAVTNKKRKLNAPDECTSGDFPAASISGGIDTETVTADTVSDGTSEIATTSPLSAATITQLANIFQVPEEKIIKMRKRDSLYSLIDIVMMVTDLNNNHAGTQIRRSVKRYPELSRSVAFVQFGGQGQRPTPAANALLLAKLMLRIPNADPGKCIKAARVLGEVTGFSSEDITSACEEPVEHTQKLRDESAVGRILQRLKFEYIPQFNIAGKRVDFMITTEWGRILLEVDENQHKQYGVPSEVDRMSVIRDWALEQNGSTMLVRFNPHKFTMNGKNVPTVWKTRADTLTKLLRDPQMTQQFEIVFLYYDTGVDGKPCLLADPHVPAIIQDSTRIYLLDSLSQSAASAALPVSVPHVLTMLQEGT